MLYTGVCRLYHYYNQQKFPNTVSELLQGASSMVQQWCDRTQLSINPQKMVIVPFTKKRDLRNLNLTHFRQEVDMEGTAGEYDE
jgi:hypothetical protein